MDAEMKIDKETAEHIMKAALIAFIHTSPKKRRQFGLRNGIGTETIREVFQCLPETDLIYIEARRIITEAAKHMKRKKHDRS
jgi:hypothetical protein